jgi:hypothetical protein
MRAARSGWRIQGEGESTFAVSGSGSQLKRHLLQMRVGDFVRIKTGGMHLVGRGELRGLFGGKDRST